MSPGREVAAAVRLADGRVLITGGADTGFVVLDSAELYVADPGDTIFQADFEPVIRAAHPT
jgi:hypothetical protein